MPTTAPVRIARAEGADFWRRLANCECSTGHCKGSFIGYFQFSSDTAAKVGIDGSEPYEVQRAAAERWAEILRQHKTSPGSTAGWPNCWWVALG